MAEFVLPTEVEVAQGPSMVSTISRRRRLFALGVVLSVSLLHFVFASFYYLLGGTVPLDLNQHAFRLVGALVAESTSLLVLWYVLSERGSGWRTIGWTRPGKIFPRDSACSSWAIWRPFRRCSSFRPLTVPTQGTTCTRSRSSRCLALGSPCSPSHSSC